MSVEAPGETPRAIDDGAFDLGEGPAAALCLHGLTGRPYEIRPVAEALVRRGMRALGPMLPGHEGPAEHLADTSHEDWLAAAREALAELRAQHTSVFVAGLSMGGLLALELASEQPVNALAVIATPLALRFPIPQLVPLAKRALRFLPKRGSDIRDPVARARHPSLQVMPLASVHELMRLQQRVRRALPRIESPILIAHGVHDATANPQDARTIEASVSSRVRELLILEDSAHIVPVDHDGARLAEAVSAFFDRFA